MAVPPTGEQWTLRHGGAEAVVVECGGGLRSLTVGGHELVAGYPGDAMPSSGRGQLLVPWPNRIRDGRYPFAGQEHELPVTERATGTASHGLVRWESFTAAERDEDRVVLRHTIHPRPGYPHSIEVRVDWSLEATGLRCASTLTNTGAAPAPVGYGAHPYLALSAIPAADARLTVPAEEVVLVDPGTKTPVRTAPVGGTPFDLRHGPRLGDVDLEVLDHAFTGLARGDDGCWTVTLETPAGAIAVWGDEAMGWVQVFTGKSDPHGLPAGQPPGVAIEPLSCPADAFRSGDGLVVLDPGGSWRGQWGIELVPGGGGSPRATATG
ncbi:aldose 1-epimerase family protein [Janibacter alkaliphilus]|uniref:Aldose 1-epimerase n=1 Tax=Janibacter alkaliphilus TaxID=1069963 RepID=A0A852X117_9MICO|nr:aldose 1-epimerase family protein [Janibacter alkaliphilus]NYG37012.1 aldose 1-epimerase [Janibacter alkaliphilus]